MNLILTFLLSYLMLIGSVFSQSITAPIDHKNVDSGFFELEYEFGKSFNPELATIIVVADAQQFYVRKGRISKIQRDLFGDEFNVLGIVPRNNVSDLRNLTVSEDGTINWAVAYKLFNSFQFASDIDLIREKLLGSQKDVYLYGQSGGALLITEYLSIFPSTTIQKVFIGAAVNPVLESQLGIIHDDFSRNFLSKNAKSRSQLDSVLHEDYFDREIVAQLIQRQNFFVHRDSLDSRRSELIYALNEKDTIFVSRLKEEYQVDALQSFINSEMGIPIRVRLLEFIAPLLDSWDKNLFYPDLENSYNVAKSLIELIQDGSISYKPYFDSNKISGCKAEVFVLAGRYDHVADYRSSIYLAGILPESTLFIADDDHTFKNLKREERYGKMITSFFRSDNKEWIRSFENFRWKEE